MTCFSLLCSPASSCTDEAVAVRPESPAAEKQNKFPCFKSSRGRKVPAPQLGRSIATSKGYTELTVAQMCKRQCNLHRIKLWVVFFCFRQGVRAKSSFSMHADLSHASVPTY